MRKTKWTKEILEPAAKKCKSFAELMRHLGLKPSGGSHRLISNKIRAYQIDISHFTGPAHLKGRAHNWTKRIPFDKILVQNSSYTNTGRLKIRLIREGLLANKCHACNCDPVWLNKPLSLQLDHVNGISNDNRLANLRLLCPNCHSQTDTFSSKKLRY
jgi:hypothetical protein